MNLGLVYQSDHIQIYVDTTNRISFLINYMWLTWKQASRSHLATLKILRSEIDTTKFEFGRYWNDIPATVKDDVVAGADIKIKQQVVNYYDPTHKSVTPKNCDEFDNWRIYISSWKTGTMLSHAATTNSADGSFKFLSWLLKQSW